MKKQDNVFNSLFKRKYKIEKYPGYVKFKTSSRINSEYFLKYHLFPANQPTLKSICISTFEYILLLYITMEIATSELIKYIQRANPRKIIFFRKSIGITPG